MKGGGVQADKGSLNHPWERVCKKKSKYDFRTFFLAICEKQTRMLSIDESEVENLCVSQS